MKKVISLFLVCVILTTLIIPVCSAEDADASLVQAVSADEIAFVENAMEIRDIGGEDISVEILYNTSDEPAYLLGESENGYIVLARDTLSFRECGESDPYKDFEGNKKFYGGPLCYYVSSNAGDFATYSDEPQLYDVVNGDWTNEMQEIPFSEENAKVQPELSRSVAASGTSAKLTNAYSYVQRKAFGYNNDNSCSAVALQIALNYLWQQTKLPLVPSAFRLENLTSDANSTTVKTLYPKAHAFHRYLVDDCGMTGPCYGNGLVDGFDAYARNNVLATYNFALTCVLLPDYGTIRYEINSSRPVLITTGASIGGGWDYRFHTMVVYGARDLTDDAEMLVHTGWYGAPEITGSGTACHQTETWLSTGFAGWGYYFSYNG